jgi:hypothetical protein
MDETAIVMENNKSIVLVKVNNVVPCIVGSGKRYGLRVDLGVKL